MLILQNVFLQFVREVILYNLDVLKYSIHDKCFLNIEF